MQNSTKPSVPCKTISIVYRIVGKWQLRDIIYTTLYTDFEYNQNIDYSIIDTRSAVPVISIIMILVKHNPICTEYVTSQL